ncbi:hypothetical protein PMAYCL1PPCAC_10430 [Pristionchus mayeri]|uniref:C-type lectin domain-containing protein n=1 Tax=Pristionchus mayeri TaxID=1317129 RepID=A0AAN5CCZ2_9BILA|nr:hypothetical protein PMAYCL1PPCAC_10430 [Pristionchus mayeri]
MEMCMKHMEQAAKAVIIHDEEDNQYWSQFAGSTNDDAAFVLGLECNKDTSRWEWGDGSSIDYKPRSYDTDLNNACQYEDLYDDHGACTMTRVWILTKDGRWTFAHNYELKQLNYYCAKLVHTPQECESIEGNNDNGMCYQIVETRQNWQSAERACLMLGANRTSIHNAQEDSFVHHLAISHGAPIGLLLGAERSGQGKFFSWADESDWDYTNFVAGYPKSGFGDCVAMEVLTVAGQWVNIDCNEELPVACSRKSE